jgi:hypothetical protein
MSIYSLPYEIILEILERCTNPTDYCSALLASKCFHPIDKQQYERKREYHRKQHTISFGKVKHKNGGSFIPITNLLDEPLLIRTPAFKTPQQPPRGDKPYSINLNMNLEKTPEMRQFFDMMDGIDKQIRENI